MTVSKGLFGTSLTVGTDLITPARQGLRGVAGEQRPQGPHPRPAHMKGEDGAQGPQGPLTPAGPAGLHQPVGEQGPQGRRASFA